LAVDVELAGGQLERVREDHLARLAHEPDVVVVVGDDRCGVLAADELALDDLAVLVAEALDADVERHALEDRLAAKRLDALRAHATDSSASVVPADRAAAKNSGSARPIERDGR